MGNQATPVIDAVQDYTVEKLILSGSPFVASILGPGAYLITADLAPSFYTAPVVTGWPVVPTTLYCDEGSFNSSPRGVLTYQWFYDDMLMAGEIENFLEVDDSDVNTFYSGAEVLNTWPTFAGTQTSMVTMPALSLPASEITVEFMVNTAVTNQSGIFSYATATEFNEFTIFNANAMQMLIAGDNITTGYNITNGEWRHVAVTWRSSDGKILLYIDGQQVWSDTTNTGGTIDPAGIIILAQEQDAYGGGFDPNQVLDGGMCEVRIWDYFRSQAEIFDERLDALVGDEAGLVHYWPLNEGSGTVANDLVAVPVDGVYANVTWNINDGPVWIEHIITTNVGTDQPYHCKVTSTNALGSDVGRSNDKLLELVEPGYVYEFDVNMITGLNSPGRLDLNVAATCVISGFAHDMKCDVNLGAVLALSGFHHDFKCDVNTAEINVITGMVGLMQLDVAEMEADILTGLQSNFADVNECDCYVVQTFEDMGPLALINGDASGANMDDWTMDIGGVTMVSTAAGWSINTNRTGNFFKGDDRGLGLDSQMSQVVVLDAGILTDVDLGRIHAKPSFSFYAVRHYDGVQITLTALDAADGVLNTITGPLRKYANVGQYDDFGWIQRIYIDDPLSLPTLTRKIKVTILFEVDDAVGTANNGYIDNIVVDLLKLE